MIAPQVGPSPVSPRLAWFSPVPPDPSGIAAYTAELVPVLRARGLRIDVYTDLRPGALPDLDGVHDARDFVWRHRRAPYDLTIYQLGNARCHDFLWGYLFRHPGLVVLHDAQVHQARARALLQRWQPRIGDYLDEFAANHPDAPPDIARLVVAGLGGQLYAHWPHVRLVLQAARLAAVHGATLAARLGEAHGVDIAVVPMGVPDPLAPAPALSRDAIRARHHVPAGAVVVGAIGGVTPEKRLPELLDAVAALAPEAPSLHVLVMGAAASHYDVAADAAAKGVADRVHVTGYVRDDELGAYLAACDLASCLRWPTNFETSASWWRAMAAGLPTIVTDLSHQPEIPVVDPRGWRPLGTARVAPVAVAVPILDERQGLHAALDTLIRNTETRRSLGAAARAYWQAHHTLPAMADAYETVIARALARTAPRLALPAHLRVTAGEQLDALLAPFGLTAPEGVRVDEPPVAEVAER